MSAKQNNKVYGREELKQYFRNGKMPTESHFGYLIDSTINKQEDGFSRDEENGLRIAALGASKNLVSFYKAANELQPFFQVAKDEQESPGLRLQPNNGATDPQEVDASSFFFHMDGKLGVGKKCDPNFRMDVNGFVGMEGRMGTFKTGRVLADGKWHPILEDLDNCQAFEVMARTGLKHAGRHAITHAYALSAFASPFNKIRQTCSYHGFFWNKIKLRWSGRTHSYQLQIRTNSNYGQGVEIFYHITRLWADELFMTDDYYYKNGR
ncbi:hypothetical protein F0L74_27860 [Chitinophaga agrisoli]|uniref:Uncharacterized protein n=1 Tax=Chitinophaga agrisoli TaxID=2607653 RepID=A0A5B2VMT2_9BACT|nr:hypothetical protein [Chitinophaga agrisoli]KAA2239998.1 hypothetical protein F0L74_27860 [Chitinophaga agrisoli]